MAMIEISVERFEDLLRTEKILNALEAGGVDNWSGYEYAFEGFED